LFFQKGAPSGKAHEKVRWHKETAIHLYKDQLWQSLPAQAAFDATCKKVWADLCL